MIKVYVAQRMSGLYCDEILKEALMLCSALRNWGFEPLSPVIEENVPNEHKLLEPTSEEQLKRYWKRDKELLQEAHILLDYNSCNRSDGVNVELGYNRFYLWKPTVRVYPNLGYCISRIEFDHIAASLFDALVMMRSKWGTNRKLLKWRLSMLLRCIPKFILLQIKFIGDLI